MSAIGIIGVGNIGGAIAKGLVKHGNIQAEDIHISRRNKKRLQSFKEEGFSCHDDNISLLEKSDLIIVAVLPGQAKDVFEGLAPALQKGRHTIVSGISATSIDEINQWVQRKVPVVRITPNTAIEFGESMTCIAGTDPAAESLVDDVFSKMGTTMVIQEKLMPAAIILAACGIAFFLRFIRADTQGGIQIGFNAEQAGKIAAQTAKGAAEILLSTGNHPEREIDKVTTPMGITITGLNEMEHYGLSSALIKGIIASHSGISELK